MARITLWGFYQYDKTLFDGAVLPDGMEKNILVNSIMKESGDLYPYHQVPEMLKENITFWFSRRLFDFDRMYQALRADYSPIENYDRIENISRSYENSGADKATITLGTMTRTETAGADSENVTRIMSDTTESSGTDMESVTRASSDTTKSSWNNSETTTLGSSTTTTHNGADTLEKQVAAYNDANYANREKETQNYNSTVTNTGSGADTTQTEYGLKRSEVEETRVHGNIGVTTAQQMIEAEIALRIKYDMYKIITMEFEREFLVQIY